MSKTPEEVKQEILEEFDEDTARFDIASSCRPEISRLISTALDRYGEAVLKEWANKKCEQLFLTLTEGKTVDQMKEAAVAQERERVKEWAKEKERIEPKHTVTQGNVMTVDYDCTNLHHGYMEAMSDLREFLSPNKK